MTSGRAGDHQRTHVEVAAASLAIGKVRETRTNRTERYVTCGTPIAAIGPQSKNRI